MGAKHVLLNHFSQRYPKLPDNLDLSGGAGAVSTYATAETRNTASAHPTTSGDTYATASSTNTTPSPTTDEQQHRPVVAMSFDFMSVKVRDMFKVAHYLEPIAEFYKDGEDEAGGTTGDGEVEEGGGGAAQVANGGKGKKQKDQAQPGAQGKVPKQPKQVKQANQPKQPKQLNKPKEPKQDNERDVREKSTGPGDDARAERNGEEVEGQSRAEKRPSEESGSSPDRKRAKEGSLAPQ